jgi:hypothetical protein
VYLRQVKGKCQEGNKMENKKLFQDKTMTQISVSKIQEFLKCPFSFYGKYILKIPQKRKLSVVLGAIFDETINENYSAKLFSDKDLPSKEVVEIFASKFENEIQTIEIWDDEEIENNPSIIKDIMTSGVELFHKEVCHFVNPESVQPFLKMSFKNSPITIFGKPDVIEIEDRSIRDNKTSGRAWQENKANQMLQPLAYDLFKYGIGKNIRSEFFYDILIKTKKPKIQQIKVIIDDEKRKNFLRFMHSIVKQIDNSLAEDNFPPSAYYRADPLCSQKYCPVWKGCENRYHIKIRQ